MKTIKLAQGTRQLIVWGRSPAHGNSWIKLHQFSRPKNESRAREGFELIFLAKGEKPL
jgi:hypothetical protein